jgi:hypothetical protein
MQTVEEVVAALFAIDTTVANRVENDNKQLMGGGQNRLVHSAARR